MFWTGCDASGERSDHDVKPAVTGVRSKANSLSSHQFPNVSINLLISKSCLLRGHETLAALSCL